MAIMYKKFQPTDYVMVVKNGIVNKEGLGLTVLYNSMRTGVMVIPATAHDGAFAFDDLVTADYQCVCVQGAVTFVIEDFAQAVKMADFAYDRNINEKQNQALNMITKRIGNVIKAIVIREVGERDVREIIKQADIMADLIREGLANDDVITGLGVRILAINVLGINAKPETRKALEAAAREQILKEQDDAIYKRRNAAIEQERLIKENELNTEIRVAEIEKEKCEKELAGKIELEERRKEYVELEAENERLRADEKAYGIKAMMAAYENVNIALIEALALGDMNPENIMAKAFLNMGDNAEKIGTLNVTPDLLETIMNK